LRRTQFLLQLGRVDDVDEAYLNGIRIGGMGKFPPDPETAYSLRRAYPVPPGLLGEHNVLAVRVFDMMGPGGIVAGPVGLSTREDYRKDTAAASGPSASWHRLVTANGAIAAVFDAQRGLVESVRPHMFQAYDSSRFVQPYLLRVKPTLAGMPGRVRYVDNTHVIAADYGDVQVAYFAPMGTGEKIFYAVVSGPRAKVQHTSFTYTPGMGTLLVDSLLLSGAGTTLRKFFLFGVLDAFNTDASTVARAKEELSRSGGTLLEREIAWMRALHARVNVPKGISAKERRVFEQSVSVLLMAQVNDREVFPRSRGQILASLPPGEWNITWVRDGFYATLALNRLGLFSRARKFLEFMLDAPSGQYVTYTHADGSEFGVGVPYQISVTRYFGSGREESDFNGDGPNIELDGFGLFLSAFADYVRASGDSAFFRDRAEVVARRVADPLVHCLQADGLVRRDSGPWERHLPGKRFAYTSIAAAAGLRDFSALCARFGRDGEAARYLREADRVTAGIRSLLVVDGRVIKGNVEAADRSRYDFYDGGTIEAFTQRVLDDRELFYTHMKEYESTLRLPGPRRGFSRINGGDGYETAEWIMLDLRTASAYHRYGAHREARALLDWVTDQAALNYNLLPELFDRVTGRYAGSIPMVGFGAGAYIVTLGDLAVGPGR
jgi:hypothetical protein